MAARIVLSPPRRPRAPVQLRDGGTDRARGPRAKRIPRRAPAPRQLALGGRSTRVALIRRARRGIGSRRQARRLRRTRAEIADAPPLGILRIPAPRTGHGAKIRARESRLSERGPASLPSRPSARQ